MQAGKCASEACESTVSASHGSDDLLKAYRDSKDSKSRDELVLRHLELVQRIAAHQGGRSNPNLLDDLSQVGCIGLLNAIERFDPGVGRSFEAFARSCIQGEILHYLRDHAQVVRVPRELQELRPQVERARARLEQCLQGSPSAQEVADEIGAPVSKVAEVFELQERAQAVSLDAEFDTLAAKPLKYQLVDSRYRNFQLAEEDRIMLAQALERLRQVSREVIEFAFFEDLTQTEIAKKLGISQMQVSRRIRKALGELWNHLNSPLW